MEAYFPTMFEDVRHEQSLMLLLSITDPDLLKKAKLTDHEINNIKNFDLEKLHGQKCSKEYFALQLLE